MLKHICLTVCSAAALVSAAQNDFGGLFKPSKPTGPDVIYYPFYDGVQMIEIDNVGYWDADINYHEMTQPRALEWSMLIPAPDPNVYLFRNTNGEIVKAYNTLETLVELTKQYSKIPIDQKSTGMRSLARFHKDQAIFRTGGTIRDFESSNSFNGFYKVYDMTEAQPHMVWGYGCTDVTTHCGDLVGLIDSLGNIVLPMEYNTLRPVGSNILVARDSVCGVINYNWEPVVPLEFDTWDYATSDDITFSKKGKIYLVYRFRENRIWNFDGMDELPLEAMWNVRYNGWWNHNQPRYFRFRKDGKYGLMDSAFSVVTSPLYDYVSWFSEGRMLVLKGNKYGYLDSLGKEVISCQYDYAERFIKGIAVVQKNGKYLNIDRNGKEVKFERQHEQWRDRGGYKLENSEIVWTMSCGYGVVDNNGKFIIPPIYDNISIIRQYRDRKMVPSEKEFMARHNGKLGVVDSAGNVLLPFEYELINDYPSRGGKRIIKKSDHEWGMVDAHWNIIVPCIYDGVSMGYDWDYIVYHVNNKQGIMDTTGKVMVPAEYTQILRFVNGHATAIKDSLYGMVDTHGNTLIPFIYEQLGGEFWNGLCQFKQNGKWGYLDSMGVIVIPAQFDEVRTFKKTIAGVKKGEKFGFIDRTGKLVVPYQYDFVGWEWYFDGTVEVDRGEKIGLMDVTGKEVVPCIYDRECGSGPAQGHCLEKNGVKTWVKVE